MWVAYRLAAWASGTRSSAGWAAPPRKPRSEGGRTGETAGRHPHRTRQRRRLIAARFSSLRADALRVERVLQAVGEEVRADHGEGDCQTGEERVPDRAVEIGLGGAEHVAPGWFGWLTAQPQK